MSFVLVYSQVNSKPAIGQVVNINADSEYGRPLKRSVNRHVTTVYADEYEAGSNMPDPKDVVYAVPFLADGVKDTAKMTKLRERINTAGEKVNALKAEWKPRALAVKSKTCFHCKSKITMNHTAINNGRTDQARCPNCHTESYLLTQGSRDKIAKLNANMDDLRAEFKILFNKEVEKAVKKNAKIHYLVGGWIHECDVDDGDYEDY